MLIDTGFSCWINHRSNASIRAKSFVIFIACASASASDDLSMPSNSFADLITAIILLLTVLLF